MIKYLAQLSKVLERIPFYFKQDDDHLDKTDKNSLNARRT